MLIISTNTSLFCSELWVLPVSKPMGRAYLSDLQTKVVEAFNLRTGNPRKSEHLFLRGEEVSLVEFTSGFVRIRFCASGPNSKLCQLVRYFASFERVIWLGAKCRVQAAVSSYYEDLVKFAQLGHKTEGCPLTNFRVRFDTPVPEIQVGGREDWVQLNSLADLPYSVPSGRSYSRYCKLRHDRMATGHRTALVPKVSAPPVGGTSGAGGGAQSGPHCTSTPRELL